jgi:uncharacterized protein with NAD-binding domain and iron-sulfur cluster
MNTKKIVVLGGGVGGMSVAHELLARNDRRVHFEVQVYEREPEPWFAGGKARSIPVPQSGTEGRPDLPGEHGFRFFPGFYRHLPDTMRTIPYHGRRTVFDNLVAVPRVELARFDQRPIVACARFPRTLGDLETIFREMFDSQLDLRPGELEFFAARIWQIMTSCEDRRLDVYEKISWWNYLEADRFSDAYRHLLANGLSRSLLANNPHHANARTVGDTNVQLMLDLVAIGGDADRVLNGPTTLTWLTPWLTHLQSDAACTYELGCHVKQLLCADGRISGAVIEQHGAERVVTGDYYVCCIPVERMATLLDASRVAKGEDPLQLDPTLAGITTLGRNVAWMNGMQFFLYRNVDVVPGHTLYVDSPWSLASISEAQFWSEIDVTKTGDGTVHGVLSVCISDWNAAGLNGKKANECTRQEIADEVWAQLKRSLNVDGKVVLDDADRHSWFLDPDIRDDPADRAAHYHDLEPLLVNFADTWGLRPDAFTRIPNLFLASDYVRTNTDVACMEAANEAARRAVNCIIDASGSGASWCEIWKLHEPLLFAPFRAHDQSLYDRGLPWSGTLF